MNALKKSTQSEVIRSRGLTQHIPIELADVWNALISIQKHISKLTKSIKNLSGNRTSGTINLCAIDSARRLNEKLQHGGIHYAHCH
jgi:hypothetical protein